MEMSFFSAGSPTGKERSVAVFRRYFRESRSEAIIQLVKNTHHGIAKSDPGE
jgi:hypothetical protein